MATDNIDDFMARVLHPGLEKIRSSSGADDFTPKTEEPYFLEKVFEERQIAHLIAGSPAAAASRLTKAIYGHDDESAASAADMFAKSAGGIEEHPTGWRVISRGVDGKIAQAFARGTRAEDAELRLERVGDAFCVKKRSGETLPFGAELLFFHIDELFPA